MKNEDNADDSSEQQNIKIDGVILQPDKGDAIGPIEDQPTITNEYGANRIEVGKSGKVYHTIGIITIIFGIIIGIYLLVQFSQSGQSFF